MKDLLDLVNFKRGDVRFNVTANHRSAMTQRYQCTFESLISKMAFESNVSLQRTFERFSLSKCTLAK